jgi:hypothetical protein
MTKLLDTRKEFVLEINTKETKYMLISYHQNAGQKHVAKLVNKALKIVAEFKCLDMGQN